ncbi:hypothetical protein TRIUR3_33836 [Triticum urartu]|uniref:Uncharacterized protein n=1 Tax=Triticum urartu TaxID=4572 RepID=M7ZN40_TRIUA|nr:hypothetical protein TRIUR3_33836 [Triticum urartu]
MCSHSGGRRRCTATPAAPEARSPQPPGSNRRRLGYSGTTGAAIAPAARARRRIWQARVPHLRRLGNRFYPPIAFFLSISLQPWLAPLTLALHSYLFQCSCPTKRMMRLPLTGSPECGREELSLKQSAPKGLPLTGCPECGRECGMPKEWQGYEGASLFFNVQSQVVYHMTDVWFKQLTDFGMFGQVKDWRFFMWLDKYLDMVEEIWMINVLIMGNASARCVSREIQ